MTREDGRIVRPALTPQDVDVLKAALSRYVVQLHVQVHRPGPAAGIASRFASTLAPEDAFDVATRLLERLAADRGHRNTRPLR